MLLAMSFAEPASVEDLLNYRLNRLLASSGAMVTRLCEGRYGITRREWRLICILAIHGALSPSELAQRAHLERARVSRHISALIAKKLISRLDVPGDGRRALVQLEAAGASLHAKLFPQSMQLNNLILHALSPVELTAFDAALSRLTEAAEKLNSSHPFTEKADRRHGGSRRLLTAEPAKGLR